MLVKLTNNHNELKGMPIYINTDHIISVYEVPVDGGSLMTAVYGIRGESWFVEEGLSEAVSIVNGVAK